MITIQIQNNTPAGITLQADGINLPCVLDLTLNCEHSADCNITYLATVAHTSSVDGKAVAQVLKDHGFQVRVLDYTDMDKDGNPFEYLM